MQYRELLLKAQENGDFKASKHLLEEIEIDKKDDSKPYNPLNQKDEMELHHKKYLGQH